jgi:peptide/nickel transport system substrate-binding protein
MKQMDTILWSDLATIPLYAFPGILATGTNVEGVQANSTQADLTWNAFAWNVKS